jgi:hypothetical protein
MFAGVKCRHAGVCGVYGTIIGMTSSWPYPVNTPGMLTGMEGLAYPQFVPPPGLYVQDPTEVLDYQINWADFLPTGDAIASSAWTADTGLTVTTGGYTATTTTVWVSGGTARYLYRVTNTVTTTGGRTIDKVLKFKIVCS